MAKSLKINQKTQIMKDREHNGQKFEDTKIRRHKSMKDREHNGQSLKIKV